MKNKQDNKIDNLKKKLHSFVPVNWQACEGFFLSMMTGDTSGGHVSICPIREPNLNTLQRNEKYRPIAENLENQLRNNNFKVRRDGWTVYVFP